MRPFRLTLACMAIAYNIGLRQVDRSVAGCSIFLLIYDIPMKVEAQTYLE